MSVGLCCDLASARAALELGFDYVELPACEIAAAADLGPYRELPALVANRFFPPDLRLFGPAAGDWRAYAARAIERCAACGVRVMVVGSGPARLADRPGEAAEQAFAELCAELQGLAAKFGVAIAPESLSAAETNVGNRLAELVERLVLVGVGYTADLFHILEASPRPSFALELPMAPMHVHLADRRREPPELDDPEVLGFADRLAELGYRGRASLECRTREPEALARGLAAMRASFDFSHAAH